jgi:uncharacterized membrane protein YphA (DoxX/SURF4 family)
MTKLDFLWPAAIVVIRLALGGLLVWTGLEKIQRPYEFLGAVYNYELVSPTVGLMIATILPWAEVCVGASLIMRVMPRGAALLAVALFTMFTVALASAAGDGTVISCGCGIASPATDVTGPGKLAASVGLLAASAMLLVDTLRRPVTTL